MCRVFNIIKQAAINHFPGNHYHITLMCYYLQSTVAQAEVVRYTAVSAFVFLRLFAPAILNPKLFGLRPEYAVGCHDNINTYRCNLVVVYIDSYHQ